VRARRVAFTLLPARAPRGMGIAESCLGWETLGAANEVLQTGMFVGHQTCKPLL